MNTVMDERELYNARVLCTVAHLLEFYDKGFLHRFFHECDEQECDIGEAFLALDLELRNLLSANGCIPDFGEIAGAYAEGNGWKLSNNYDSQPKAK